MIDIGEKSQALEDIKVLGFIYAALANLYHGAPSDNYRRLRWQPLDNLLNQNDQPVTLPVVPGNPNLSRLSEKVPRFKPAVAVVAAGRQNLNDIIAKHKGSRAAAAYSYKGESHVGLMPNDDLGGLRSFGYTGIMGANRDFYTAKLRTGRNEFSIGIGAFIGKSTMVIPDDLRVIYHNIPIGVADRIFPDSPVV